jgi:hypothetical protein
MDRFQGDQGDVADAYVAKLNPDPGGTAPATIAYSTYLGGSQADSGIGIAVDSARAAYVTGNTSSPNFPTREAFQGHGGDNDAFVTKLSPDTGGAATLAYSTYLGGGAGDFGSDIAVDPARAAYVTGAASSTNFPTQDRLQGDQPDRDGFVARLVLRPPATGGGGGGGGGAAADTDPPETTIDKAPKRKTRKRKAKFRFSSDEPGSSFMCKLDKRQFAPCEAQEQFKVKRRKHKLRVQAIDQAGNVDPSPALHRWKVKRKRKR